MFVPPQAVTALTAAASSEQVALSWANTAKTSVPCPPPPSLPPRPHHPSPHHSLPPFLSLTCRQLTFSLPPSLSLSLSPSPHPRTHIHRTKRYHTVSMWRSTAQTVATLAAIQLALPTSSFVNSSLRASSHIADTLFVYRCVTAKRPGAKHIGPQSHKAYARHMHLVSHTSLQYTHTSPPPPPPVPLQQTS